MPSAASSSASLLLSLALASVACSPAPAPTSEETAAGEPEAAAQVEAETPAPAKTGGPSIASPNDTFEFGSLRPGETVTHVFTIENHGDADLHIDGVRRT